MLKDLCYTTNESIFFTNLLNENGFNSINDSISGANVVKLFLKSKLDKLTLKKIWDLSSERKAPDLNKLEFFCACRLVALSQIGQELTMQNAINLNYKDVMPKFEGVVFDPNKKNTNNTINNRTNNIMNMGNSLQYNNNYGNQQRDNASKQNLNNMLNNFNFSQNSNASQTNTSNNTYFLFYY